MEVHLPMVVGVELRAVAVKVVALLHHPASARLVLGAKGETVFLEAMPQPVGAGVDIMEVVVVGINLLERTLQLLAVAAPATRATLAMRPCKRAFAMGMGKSSLPIKKAA
jgi:hypothetical protein